MLFTCPDYQHAQGRNRRLYTACRRALRHIRLFAVIVPQHIEHGAHAHMQRRTGGEQRRRLHLTGEHARCRPCRPFFLQICRNRLTLRTNFAVKAVLGLNHADMGSISQRLAGICQRVHDRIARRRRILQRQIFARCALLPNRRCRDHNIAAAHSRIHAAAGTHTDKCICAALDQFFQRNRRRRPADARRAHRHAFTVQMSRIHMKFSIV